MARQQEYKRYTRSRFGNVVYFAFLFLMGAFSVLPLVYCICTSLKPLDELLKNLDRLPDPKRTAIRNNGGGVYNHLLYFDGMCACHSSRPSGGLAMAMERDFGSFEGWKEQMKAAALGQFGSGYAWLVSETSGKLSVMKLPNQDCPLSMGLWPVLCLDVWEHAYYLDYQNRRAEYVDRWFERVNWPFAQERYEGCRQ